MEHQQIKLRPTKTLAIIFFVFTFFSTGLLAQHPGAGQQNADRSSMNIGRFYGKLVDEEGKGIGYAAIQLFGMTFDQESRSMKETMITGQITEDNGDFSLENLPIMGNFTLKASVLGYADLEKTVTFGIPMRKPGEAPKEGQSNRPTQGGSGNRPGGGMGGGNFDIDLGNIVMKIDAQTLDEIIVEGEATNVKLALDKKIFRVDKDASAAGGTAVDALRNVPSLSVDIDGNLTLRNASPQVFIDGRPTTLTLDQLAASEIETVEVITNPSAKYDASGGQGGIVNIVLKKDRRLGYHGSLRAGGDSQGGFNLGGDLNVREGKINAFVNGFYNNHVRNSENETDRQNLFGNPLTNIFQRGDNNRGGSFASLRGGIDWFVDNRNTLTFEGSFRRGQFDSENILTTTIDSLYPGNTTFSESVRTSDSERQFRSLGGSVLYKHLFPKKGRELTADVNYSRFKMDNYNTFQTNFTNTGASSREIQEGNGTTSFITLQTDYVDPVGDNAKIELGARGTFRNFVNNNASFVFNQALDDFVRIFNFTDEYEFSDNVLAAYGTFSQEFKKWGYSAGVRVESSQYTGELPESQDKFENDFPLSVFPSAFLTYKLNDQDNLQASYTRRINRPSFFNLIPFTDFTDSLNLRRGNPDLLPEFTNSLELTYQNIFKQGDNLLISAYLKQASDLITTFQETEFDPFLQKEVVVQTYQNSNSSLAYGVEFTLRNTLVKNVTLTSNLNLYNSRVDASNIQEGLINEQFTWFLKENLMINMPKLFTLQINGEYKSRAAFSPSSGSGRFHGFMRSTNTAQGYTLPSWFVNVSIRKNIMKRKGSITLSVSDIFRSRQRGTHSESEFFIQDTWSLGNPQQVRLNFSYNFGKRDASLFKRKNTNQSNEGSELMN